MSKPLQYRPEIDGMRAIAVVAVIVFHFVPEEFKAGFIGVDIFFVLSGFLISSIFMRELDQKTFKFAPFWARRIKRILPASLLVVVCVLTFTLLFVFFGEWRSVALQGATTLMFVANVEMWKHAADYWGAGAENAPLLHMWSLSIEEQFYIFFPFLFVFSYRKSKRIAFVLVLVLTIISCIAGIIVTQSSPHSAFYLLPTRAWELGAGVLAAFLIRRLDREELSKKVAKPRMVFAWLSTTGLGLSLVFLTNEDFPGWKAIWPVLATAIMLVTLPESRLLKRVRSLAPFVWKGKLSYSLYLWHWPIIVYCRKWSIENDVGFPFIFAIVLTLVCSIVSYYCIENFFRFKGKLSYLFIALTAIYSGIVVMILSFYMPVNLAKYKSNEWYGELYNNSPRGTGEGFLTKRRNEGMIWPKQPKKNRNSYKESGVLALHGDSEVDIVVLGSSYAVMWSSAIDALAKKNNWDVSFFASDGTTSYFNPAEEVKAEGSFTAKEHVAFNNARQSSIMSWRPRIVIIAERWTSLNYTEQEFLAFVQRIQPKGTKFLFLTEPPQCRFGNYSGLQYFAHKSKNINESLNLPRAKEKEQKSTYRWLANLCGLGENLFYLDILPNYLEDNKAIFAREGKVFYRDDDHLSHYGAMWSSRLLETTIKRLLATENRINYDGE